MFGRKWTWMQLVSVFLALLLGTSGLTAAYAAETQDPLPQAEISETPAPGTTENTETSTADAFDLESVLGGSAAPETQEEESKEEAPRSSPAEPPHTVIICMEDVPVGYDPSSGFEPADFVNYAYAGSTVTFPETTAAGEYETVSLYAVPINYQVELLDGTVLKDFAYDADTRTFSIPKIYWEDDSLARWWDAPVAIRVHYQEDDSGYSFASDVTISNHISGFTSYQSYSLRNTGYNVKLPITDPAYAAEISLSNISVSVEDQPVSLTGATYDGETGILTIPYVSNYPKPISVVLNPAAPGGGPRRAPAGVTGSATRTTMTAASMHSETSSLDLWTDNTARTTTSGDSFHALAYCLDYSSTSGPYTGQTYYAGDASTGIGQYAAGHYGGLLALGYILWKGYDGNPNKSWTLHSSQAVSDALDGTYYKKRDGSYWLEDEGKTFTGTLFHDITQQAVWAFMSNAGKTHHVTYNRAAIQAVYGTHVGTQHAYAAEVLYAEGLLWAQANPSGNAEVNAILDKIYFLSDTSSMPGEWGRYYQPLIAAPLYNPEPDKGSVTVVKSSSNPAMTNKNSCYSLAGAKYQLYTDYACNTPVSGAVFTIRADGTSNTIGDINVGAYYIKETVAGRGYLLDTAPHKVTVEKNKTATVYVQDAPDNDPIVVRLDKVSRDNMSGPPLSLAGAKFSVTWYSGFYTSESAAEAAYNTGSIQRRTWIITTKKVSGQELYRATLDDSTTGDPLFAGVYGQNVVPYGTLIIKETQAPAGYINDPQYSVSGGAVTNDKAVIFQIDGSDQIFRYVRTGNYMDEITMTVYEPPSYGSVVVQKTSSDNLNSGIQFRLTGTSEDGATVNMTATTNGSGTAAFYYVPPSNSAGYTVSEVNVPSRYFATANKTGVRVTSGNETTVSVYNEETSVNLYKVDDNGRALAGARLHVEDTSGRTVVSAWTSGASPKNVRGLNRGATYYLVEESQPSGYWRNTSKTPFTVPVNKPGGTASASMTNHITITRITKTDLRGVGLAGAVLRVVDSGNNKIDEWITTASYHEIKGLVAGASYRVIEVTPAPGYTTAAPVSFTVTTTDGTVTTASMRDDTTKYAFTKMSQDGYQLPGASLQVADSNGVVVDTWTTDGSPHQIIGKLVVGQTYTLSEVGTPRNYDKAESISFLVPDRSDTQSITMTDYLKHKDFTFLKTTYTNTPLEGGRFTLYACSNIGASHQHSEITSDDTGCWKKYDTQTSDSAGQVTFENLTATRTYALVEEAAPDGMQLSKGYWLLTYNEDGDEDTGYWSVTAEGTGKNLTYAQNAWRLADSGKYDLPQAGGKGKKLFVFIGILAMSAAMVAVGTAMKGKRILKKEEN